MLESARVNIVTDASGNATAYIAHGSNTRPHGLLVALIYRPGTIATGADLTITGETSGIPILTVTDAGTANRVFYPRAPINEVVGGGAASSGSEMIPILGERIMVVVAQGGNTATGSIEAIFLASYPY